MTLKVTATSNIITVCFLGSWELTGQEQKIADMLLAKKFYEPSFPKGGKQYETAYSDFWYDQCKKLVEKVGGEFIDKRNEPEPEPEPHKTESDRLERLEAEVQQLKKQLAIATTELERLESALN